MVHINGCFTLLDGENTIQRHKPLPPNIYSHGVFGEVEIYVVLVEHPRPQLTSHQKRLHMPCL